MSVAETVAVIPDDPVKVTVLPATTDWVVEPSDIVKPVAETDVLISLIAATIVLAVVASVAGSPISVPDRELKLVLNISNVSVVATVLVAILLYYLFN